MVCGCSGTKNCSGCRKRNFCSKEHQKVDWTLGAHKGMNDYARIQLQLFTIANKLKCFDASKRFCIIFHSYQGLAKARQSRHISHRTRPFYSPSSKSIRSQIQMKVAILQMRMRSRETSTRRKRWRRSKSSKEICVSVRVEETYRWSGC